jgi:hypothetical protein
MFLIPFSIKIACALLLVPPQKFAQYVILVPKERILKKSSKYYDPHTKFRENEKLNLNMNLIPKAITGLDPTSYRGALLSTSSC